MEGQKFLPGGVQIGFWAKNRKKCTGLPYHIAVPYRMRLKTAFLDPKCISSRLEQVQPNLVKLGNIKYKSLYTYPVYNVLCQVSSLLTITFFQIP